VTRRIDSHAVGGLRFVIIGSGNIAGTWAEVIRKVPSAALAGIVSRSGSRPRALSESEPVQTATRLDRIEVPFDAVVVATPNGMHHEGVLAAASLGKHVLSEKPLEISLEAVDGVIGACRAAGVALGVCFQRRMSPDNVAVKRLVDEGKLGRLYAVDLAVKFFREQAYYDSAAYRGGWAVDGGGPFMQQASHQIDLYCWLFGMPSEVKSITAKLAHRMEAEDHGAAVLRHPDGMIGTIVASTVCRPGFPARLELHGEAGSLVLENDVITSWLVEGLENPSRPAAAAIHSGAASAGVSDTAGHEAILADFVSAVRDGRTPAVSGESARLATQLILRIYNAAGARRS
jgi:UDP-N-acetyl-2-amino-2-deoxyglucuronate dehydrogenase